MTFKEYIEAIRLEESYIIKYTKARDKAVYPKRKALFQSYIDFSMDEVVRLAENWEKLQ